MASATRLANFTEDYPEDLKPTIQHSDSSPQEFFYPPYSTVSSPPVKYEPGENYTFFSLASNLTPASSPPAIPSITPNSSHALHNTASIDSFTCTAPLPQLQLPSPLAGRQEYSQSTWLCPPTYETSRSPQAEISYPRERSNFSHYPPRLSHRTSPQANRLSGPYATYTPDYAHLPVTDYYPPMEDFRYNDCRPSSHRIVYPHAIYPSTGHAPYGRPVQNIAAAPERPFLCDKCGARFNRNHDLKRHTRIHLEVKPFPCGWCEKAFSRKDALKRHLIVKACSGSKDVSVEESIRRAEQLGKRKLQETLSYTCSASEKKSAREDTKPEAIFNFSARSQYPLHSCASSQSHMSDKNDHSPITDTTFPHYLVRDRMCSVSDDSMSTSGSVTTCSS